ncbi:MAG: hypothetical protein RRC07_14855 [Anaerolineae bacterium]|nr:hypothetical protein [Anaerolineae bacterium]
MSREPGHSGQFRPPAQYDVQGEPSAARAGYGPRADLSPHRASQSFRAGPKNHPHAKGYLMLRVEYLAEVGAGFL